MTAALRGDARVDLRERLAERYRAGASIRTLAADTERSYGFVYALLVEAGITFRPRTHRTN
ncbi:helix-turn-helix domain-containing protein [Streptomyces sp. NPDC050738]|uniref:helix-turn-helix domain-containing protein n=1 Tax=Streptomyces sp. NPDC050738 TaxID=3154744 RepID=UPI00341E618D